MSLKISDIQQEIVALEQNNYQTVKKLLKAKEQIEKEIEKLKEDLNKIDILLNKKLIDVVEKDIPKEYSSNICKCGHSLLDHALSNDCNKCDKCGCVKFY